MQRGGRAHLDFIQNMEYKFVELLSTAFIASDEETVRQNITFRHSSTANMRSLAAAQRAASSSAMRGSRLAAAPRTLQDQDPA